METISKVTQSVHTLLESIVQREIEKDPIGFIREETFLRPTEEAQEINEEEFKEALPFDYEEEDSGEAKERKQSKKRRGSEAMYDPVLLEELEEVFHDAHDHF